MVRCVITILLALVVVPAAILGASSAPPAATTNPIQVLKRSTQTMPFPGSSNDNPAPRVNRPYFDHVSQLRWANSPVHSEATGACDTQPPQRNANGQPIYPRQTKFFAPRVDERLCSRADGTTEITLIGIDSNGKKSWQRQTVFQSGAHPIDQRLIGASGDGLVLSALEVWSPDSGKTILPPATRPIPTESRTVPLHTSWGAALYHPVRQTFYLFEANVTLTTRQGGLYELNPANGAKTLLHRVVTTLLGGFDRVEEMALTPDRRHLALAQQLSARGPTNVSLLILDLSTYRPVFFERFCQPSNDTCTDPHVVVGPKGAIGFSYASQNRREHQLIRYELVQ